MPQLCKVFAIEQTWRFLIQDKEAGVGQRFWVLEIAESPAVRIGGNATAATIQKILASTMSIDYAKVLDVVPKLTRLAETDEAPANIKCEVSLHEDGARSYQKAHVACAAHKVHAIAARTWPFFGDAVTGIISTLKILTRHGAMQAFLKALETEILDSLVITSSPLEPEAISYRQHTLDLFTPSCKEKPRSAALVRCFATFNLNGDWRTKQQVVHRCLPGCCSNKKSFAKKLCVLLPRVVSGLTVKILNRGDWKSWHVALYMVPFLTATHALFPQVFTRVFLGSPEAVEEHTDRQAGIEAEAAEDDKMASFRLEYGANVKKAATWWARSIAGDILLIMRATLKPEADLMGYMLERTAGASQVQRMSAVDSVESGSGQSGLRQHG